MKKIALAAAVVLFTASAAFAGGKTYQVTGPVLELSSSKIVVQKGAEKWEIARDSSTKIPADVKVGSKVTIEYTMTAATVTDKDAKPAEKPAKADKADKKAKK